MRRLAGLTVVFCLAYASAHAQSWGLPQLMQSLAQVRTASASFTERQTSPVLSAPLISMGTLTYVAPDYLRKVTITPQPENFVLDHDQVTISGAAGSHVFALNQDPRIAGLVEGIRGTLAGDLPVLEQFYNVSLRGNASSWQLNLSPKNMKLQHFIRAMIITGSEGQIGIIDTQSADGSDSQLSIHAGAVADAP